MDAAFNLLESWRAAWERATPPGQFLVTPSVCLPPGSDPGAQPALHFGRGNFHELSFDDVIVLIQPWYNFFANGHRYVLFATFPKMITY